jgi:hypothetical protein
MSLPACQERILSGIENELRKGAPRLASRFAIFTRLTGDEELPRTEQLVPRRWLDRSRMPAMILVPLMMLALASVLFFAGVFSGAARTCGAAVRRPAAAATRWVTCAATGKPAHGAGDANGTGITPQGTPR